MIPSTNQYFRRKSADSWPEHNGAHQGHDSPGEVDHSRPGKVVKTPGDIYTHLTITLSVKNTFPRASPRPRPSGCGWGRPPRSSGCRTGCSHWSCSARRWLRRLWWRRSRQRCSKIVCVPNVTTQYLLTEPGRRGRHNPRKEVQPIRSESIQ